jgi:hypothetical protein
MNQRTKLASALLTAALVFSLTAWSQETHQSKSEGGGQTAQDLPAHNSAQKLSAEANEQNPERYFKLTFRVLDLSAEGKVTNSRSYSETIATGPKSIRPYSIRTGDRVPVATGGGQFQYIDIGTKIDVSKAEDSDQILRLRVTADISSMSTATPGSAGQPIIRQTRWDSNITVPSSKPTIIFSSDNSADKGKTELELTAIPISE